jgi:putative ABC transport system substrate-binding protein
MLDLSRRGVIGLVGGAAASSVSWPLAARAQQGNRVRRIGWLAGLDPEGQRRNTVLVAALRDLGWIAGRNLHIDYGYLTADKSFDAQAAELIALSPDVLLANSTPATRALQQTTRTIPIVFTLVADPIASGIVPSMARPDGNITGFTNFEPTMGSKWLGLLKELSPSTRIVALIFNPRTTNYASILRSIESAAHSHGIEISRRGVADATELASAVAAAGREDGTALVVFPDIFTAEHRHQIVTLAEQYRLHAVYPYRYFTEMGGLMSYSIDIIDVFKKAAGYIDRILKGAKPADLPVQQPTKFELVINLKTAKQLGLTVPLTLQAMADEVIE